MTDRFDDSAVTSRITDDAGDGVFDTVRDGYDAVYDALPGSDTFNRLWRDNPYRAEFPAEFAHIGFLTLSEGRPNPGVFPWLWSLRPSSAPSRDPARPTRHVDRGGPGTGIVSR